MTIEEFIDNKAPQLAVYGKAFLSDELDFQEVQLYLWDTLEEWQQLIPTSEAQTETETVFWHLLHSFNKWPDWMIRGNQYLYQQLHACCDFLSLGGQMPSGCIGIRP
ncbi:hypothetical protein HRJ35_20390 [Shewanella oneidensis MR-1]|uniref:Uncharacterized protein n=1 Tax=Shewanella oneidensis (strain ATCC 700550 / JCM 31522 / CIP 106686 / LMG 19005 / NCIMB 14063 / MR-1) TaxID=211586 RepID=Q8EAS9_SHEON|nr:hypothetical protein [Shewanella oneidensis]AAN56793.1 uncharacterized protein SO_3813 [Shewanella oneidensis MR-1]MDX5998837.1 hypothetical protein [Shewanella oneidensis]MEE2027561.1 hypothetical protein [Shewanella oneidensis]QKG98123.1 hypothetical protein HRJ35_20390 [Shewanella oneidensis MR-1]